MTLAAVNSVAIFAVDLVENQGACGDGGFRHAQMGSYGIAPNPGMPGVFIAQGYDAQDPIGDSGGQRLWHQL